MNKSQRRLCLPVLALCVFLGACSSRAKAPEPELTYEVVEPQIESTRPAIVFLLHGYGSNEKDLLTVGRALSNKAIVVSLRAPHRMGPERHRWYELSFTETGTVGNVVQALEAAAQVHRQIEVIVGKLGADSARVFLLGFSQGAILSLHVALSHPEQIKGVIALSGKLMPESVKQAKGHDVSGLKVFMSHGLQDNVIPPTAAESAAASLAALGVRLDFKRYDMRHQISRDTIEDLSRWFELTVDQPSN